MASIFFCAKVLAIVLQPMAIKGAFTTLIRIYSGMPVMAELSRDIPLALPSVIHWVKKSFEARSGREYARNDE